MPAKGKDKGKDKGKKGAKGVSGGEAPFGDEPLIECPFDFFSEEDLSSTDFGDLSLQTSPSLSFDSPSFFSVSSEASTDIEGGDPKDLSLDILASQILTNAPPNGDSFVKEWKRPFHFFTPFKPVVVRQSVTLDNYGKQEEKNNSPEELRQILEEYRDKLEQFRQFRSFKNGSPRTPTEAGNRLMEGYISTLLVLHHSHWCIPAGEFLWDLISPKSTAAGMPLPQYNPHGKYAVKIWYNGGFRKVIVDDRLPLTHIEKEKTFVRGAAQAGPPLLFSVTDAKELWPSLLAKAILTCLNHTKRFQKFFKDPVFVAHTLSSGYVPNTTPVEQVTVEKLREVVEKMRDSREKSQKLIFEKSGPEAELEDESLPFPDKKRDWRGYCFLCVTSSDSQLQQAKDSGFEPAATLHGDQLYAIEDLKTLVNESDSEGEKEKEKEEEVLIHLRGSGNTVNWKGEYGYGDSEKWSADFENRLGFLRQDRIQGEPLSDFWISFSEFQRYFSQLHLFQHPLRYSHHKQITRTVLDESSSSSRLLVVKSRSKTTVYLTFHGLSPVVPETEQKEKTRFCCKVSKFEWQGESAYHPIGALFGEENEMNSFEFEVPAGTSTYQLDFSNLFEHHTFGVHASVPLVWGEFKEMCNEQLSVSVFKESSPIPETMNQRGKWNLWFKKHLTLKQETLLTSTLTLPEKNLNRKKANVQLVIVNCDTLQEYPAIIKEHVIRIPPTTLTPNTKGYSLVAFGTNVSSEKEKEEEEKEKEELGQYEMEILSNHPIDKIEARQFGVEKNFGGEYQANKDLELFHYTLSTQEATHLSLHTLLSHPNSLPFTISMYHNEDLFFEHFSSDCCSAHTCDLILVPSDKSGEHKYSLKCTLEKEAAFRIHGKVHEKKLKQLDEIKLEQEPPPLLKKEKEEVPEGKGKKKEEKKKEPKKEEKKKGKKEETAGVVPPSFDLSEHDPPSDCDVFFQVLFFASSEKLSVFNVTSREDALTSIKELWESESSGRLDKGKEARARYLWQRQNPQLRNELADNRLLFSPKTALHPPSTNNSEEEDEEKIKAFETEILRLKGVAQEEHEKEVSSRQVVNEELKKKLQENEERIAELREAQIKVIKEGTLQRSEFFEEHRKNKEEVLNQQIEAIEKKFQERLALEQPPTEEENQTN